MPSTLGNATIHTLELRYPELGDWRADLVLDAGDAPAPGSSVVLTVGDLTMQCIVLRSGLDAPDRPHVIVSGAPGWASEVTRPLSYQSDAGVRLSAVLSDISEASGQAIEQPEDRSIGEHYEVIGSRDGDPARYRDALDELAEEGLLLPWRVDPDGVTRFGLRAATTVTARATELRRGRGVGRTVYGIDSPAAFLPGRVLDGKPIALLVVTETSGRLEAEIYQRPPDAAPSMKSSVRRMVWRWLQDYVRTYVVADVAADGRLDLLPPPDAQHLPEMRNVPAWTLGGATVTPVEGAEVLVVFRDRRRTRPVAIAFAPGTPLEVELDASDEIRLGDEATIPIARENDPVTVLLPPAVFTGTIGGSPASGMVVWATQTLGNIGPCLSKVKGE